MGAAITVDRRHGRTQIQPKFGIGLAEADRAGPNDELYVADATQRRLIEARRPVEVAHRNGDVIDHCRTILVPPGCDRARAREFGVTAHPRSGGRWPHPGGTKGASPRPRAEDNGYE